MRFPEFEGEWEKKRIGDLGVFIGGGTPDTTITEYWNGNIPWISSSDVQEGKVQDYLTSHFITEEAIRKSATKLVPQNSVLIVSRVGIGKFAVSKSPICTSQDFTSLALVIDNPYFLAYYFKEKTKLFLRFSQGTSIKGFTGADIKSMVFQIPSLPEQQKIASFFTAIDRKITQLKRKQSLLEQYKKGIMQKIFSQQIRFKDDNGEEFPKWEKKKLSQIADRVTSKNNAKNENVLTISAQHGLVNQLDFFKKTVAAKDLSGYYLLKKDDFAYNKSYSTGYPMGAFKRLKLYNEGIVSPLYICFTFKAISNLAFMEQYFESGKHNRQIEKIAQEGARNHGLLNISIHDFFNTELLLPNLLEQTKIASFLSAIDDKINRTRIQIEKAETWKKGLMQQMFV